jgi:hypothetical protein
MVCAPHCENGGKAAKRGMKDNVVMRQDKKAMSMLKQSENTLFLGAWILYLGWSLLLQTFFAAGWPLASLENKVFFVCLLLLGFREMIFFLRHQNGWCDLVLLLAFGAMARIAGYFGHPFGMIFVFVFCARKMDFKQVAKTTVVVSAAVLLGTVLAQRTGFIHTTQTVRDGQIRQYLGFLYVLTPSVVFFNIAALHVYLRQADISWGELIVLAAINAWLYMKTNARLSMILIGILLCYAMVIKCRPAVQGKMVQNRLGVFWPFSFVLGAVVTAGVTRFYAVGQAGWQRLNLAVGNRLWYGQAAFKTYGVKPFGQTIAWVGNGLQASGKPVAGIYNYVDNFYLHYLLNFGFVFSVLFIAVLTTALWVMLRKGEGWLLMIFALLACHGLIDDMILYPYFNAFLLSLSPYLLLGLRALRIRIRRQRQARSEGEASA